MTVALARLPVTERARMIRELDELMRDTRYRTLPIGREVARAERLVAALAAGGET